MVMSPKAKDEWQKDFSLQSDIRQILNQITNERKELFIGSIASFIASYFCTKEMDDAGMY